MSKNDKKRKKPLISSPSSPLSPPFIPVMDPTMNAIMDKLNQLSGQMSELLAKSDKQEAAITKLEAALAASTEENRLKDKIISKHTDQINNCEQSMRSSSLRIIGLPVTMESTPSTISNCVYELIMHPILEAAKCKGELDSYPSRRFLIDSAFTIPSKNPHSSPVIVKITHTFIRNLIFQLKKDVLPYTPVPNTNRTRPKYGIYEDLTPANFQQFRTMSDDERTTAIWTYNGQIKFKIKDRESIFRVRSLVDTVDTLTKTFIPP